MRDKFDDLRGLRLAVLAPISWPVPPPGYGPWEQVSYNIAQGMRARGLDVTLYAAGNSHFEGRLRSVLPISLNEDRALDGNVFEGIHIGTLFEEAERFDLIHNNFDWKPMTYALARTSPPMLTTIHGFSQPQILAAYYACAHRSFFTSISDADRDPGLRYLGTTYNGIDASQFTFRDAPGDYLLFIGRFHPEKGTHLAIEIAKRAGMRIKLAGIPHDERYFDELVSPHIDGDAVEFLGEVRGA
ncbi:MAG: glycosyltransferase, partial [Candidatus Eremiobacteraeota bacterium]|nr:glycosyltransferase [Candidatus Eremiobacteraeota bacterium]